MSAAARSGTTDGTPSALPAAAATARAVPPASDRRDADAAGAVVTVGGPGVPPVPALLVRRSRLFARLASGVRGPLTLVAAPAGMGKTVLLASWIAAGELPGPALWLTLHTGDRDPQQFWGDLVRALRRSAVPADLIAAVRPGAPGEGGTLVHSLLDLAERLREPVVLVLDDFHAIAGSEAVAAVDALLRQPRALLRLVIATRADPALAHMPRLRLDAALTELRSEDLAFTAAETAELLDGHGVRLSDASLALLRSRTQGWAAGLRLAALWLQRRPDPSAAVSTFAGTDRTVGDYLVAEVLDTAELDHLEAQVLDPVQQPVQRGLVGKPSAEHRLDRLG
ncbi:MAG TPA: AAA family ATPase [Euzebyales bacterium]|nr:AAA family ATPase [Euzebyales bacterium]